MFPAKKYDFRQWADGKRHVALRGEHYDTPELTFCKAAWMWGDRHGYRFSFRRGDQCVELSFKPAPGQVPA